MIITEESSPQVKRLEEVHSFDILDTLPEADYDNLTMLAAHICGTKVSLVSIVENDRQWFKSGHGWSVRETPISQSFCAHALKNPGEVFIVTDATKDERFFDNPLVTGPPNVVFYAGVPLVSKNGFALGTLCVIDDRPRTLSDQQIEALTILSSQVMRLLELRKKSCQLEKALERLEENNKSLERFAFTAAHDLKSPLKNLMALSQMLSENMSGKLTKDDEALMEHIIQSSDKLTSLVDGLLEYSRVHHGGGSDSGKETVHLESFMEEIQGLLTGDERSEISLRSELESIQTHPIALRQVIINLVANALKYNDKDVPVVEISVAEGVDHYLFSVSDNGPGIDRKNHKKIFEIFNVISSYDRYGKSGNGIGLATVKRVIESQGGSISVESELGKGAKFMFTLRK